MAVDNRYLRVQGTTGDNRSLATQLYKPSPPRAYQGLKTGPDMEISYEDNIGIPVDLSDKVLRSLSPFVLQVEPPLAFAASPVVVGGKKKGMEYGAILSGNTSFSAARANLSTASYTQISSQSGSVEETITKNATSAMMNRSGDGSRITTLTGDTPVKLGQPAIADVYTAVDIAMQLSAVLNTPPLVLLINPESMVMNFTKVQQYSDRTRYGYVFHQWGEEQPRMSVTAKCGAFVSGGRGVQYASKRDSASWQNLMNAFHMYKNNGYIHDTVGGSNAHHFVGALSIHYDQWIYYGNLQSMSHEENEADTQMGGVTFTMEFVVNAAVDTAQASKVVTPMRAPTPSPSDPRYSGMQNRGSNQAWTFSVGGNGEGGISLSTQGREVSLGEAVQSTLPGNVTQLFDNDFTQAPPEKEASSEAPVGDQGFQQKTVTPVLAPQLSTDVFTVPFGV